MITKFNHVGCETAIHLKEWKMASQFRQTELDMYTTESQMSGLGFKS